MEENKYLKFKKGFQFINYLDEQNRYNGFKVYLDEYRVQQFDTHGASYKYARDMFKQLGDKMGFDNDNLECILK